MAIIDKTRTTAGITEQIEAAIRAAGHEPRSEERWEGDGVTETWIPGAPGKRTIHTAGTDSGLTPAVRTADDEDREITTTEEAIAHLTG